MWHMMHAIHVLLAASLVALSACVDSADMDLANSNTAFGFNLLNIIQDDEGGNVFLSPFSISTALAMSYAGADGNTKDQLSIGLQISDYENPLRLFENLNERLFPKHSSNGCTLRQANKLYGSKDIIFKRHFLTDLRKYFDAPISKVNFELDSTREDINLWVQEHTEQKIKDLLAAGDLSEAKMILINAIYFKALWLKPFKAGETSERDFKITPTRSVTVDMMHMKATKFNIGKIPDVNARILEMEYKCGTASMFIILPDASAGLCEVQEGLTMSRLARAVSGMSKKLVRIQVPKFEVKDRIKLKKYLSKMNMTDMFIDKVANFSKITDDLELFMSDVIHQSFVRVDEKGTEAAAATGPIFTVTSVQQADSFYVNKPFLFLIRDSVTQSVLFMGRVVDPTDAEDLGADGYQCQPQTLKYTAAERAFSVVYTDNGVALPALSVWVAILAAIFVEFVSE